MHPRSNMGKHVPQALFSGHVHILENKSQVPLQLTLIGNCTGGIIIYHFDVWRGPLIEFDNNTATELGAPGALLIAIGLC